MRANLWKFTAGFRILIRDKFIRALSTKEVKLTEDNVEEIKVPVPWGHIAGKWWGDKNLPPIIAVHGWEDNANAFNKLIPLLNAQSVLAIDLPGHGHSSHIPEGRFYDFGEYVIGIHRIKNHFNLKKFSLLTHSLGSSVGLAYASMYPETVSYVMSFECGRCRMLGFRSNLSTTMQNAYKTMRELEKQKESGSKPIYKLSRMIKMYMIGSLGSINTPEDAMIILKRGADVVDEKPSSEKIDDETTDSDYLELLAHEENLAMSEELEKKEILLKNIADYKENWKKVKEMIEDLKLDVEDEKYYALRRDPKLKIRVFQCFTEEFLLEAVKNIKCPFLSIRAKGAFFRGSWDELYNHHLDIIKKNARYFEKHEIEGTRYAHLTNPENLAPIINEFMKKVLNLEKPRTLRTTTLEKNEQTL